MLCGPKGGALSRGVHGRLLHAVAAIQRCPGHLLDDPHQASIGPGTVRIKAQ